MTKYQRRCLEMFQRVCGFSRNHSELFPAGTPGGDALATVAQATEDIRKALVAQVAAVDDKRWRARERAALTRFLLSMARTARQIARVERRVERTLVMPSPRTDETLLDTARVFLREATPMQPRFIALGMPATFLADLRERTDRFEKAVRWRREARSQATVARVALAAAIRRGFDAVLAFDVIVANAMPGDLPTLAAWKGARRVDRARARRVRPTTAQPRHRRHSGTRP